MSPFHVEQAALQKAALDRIRFKKKARSKMTAAEREAEAKERRSERLRGADRTFSVDPVTQRLVDSWTGSHEVKRRGPKPQVPTAAQAEVLVWGILQERTANQIAEEAGIKPYLAFRWKRELRADQIDAMLKGKEITTWGARKK